jgi:hypothetical protein
LQARFGLQALFGLQDCPKTGLFATHTSCIERKTDMRQSYAIIDEITVIAIKALNIRAKAIIPR